MPKSNERQRFFYLEPEREKEDNKDNNDNGIRTLPMEGMRMPNYKALRL